MSGGCVSCYTAWLTLAALLCGCSKQETASAEARRYVVGEPPAEISVELGGKVDYRDRETVKPPVEDLMLEWLIEDGLNVEPGDVIARFDVELLDLWLQNNRRDLEILERKRRAANLASARQTEKLRKELLESQAQEKALVLQYEESKRRDEAQRAVLVRELELAKTALDEAESKLSAIKNLASLGGAAAREVRDAVMAYERQRAQLRTPQIRLEIFDETTGSTERMLLEQDLAAIRLSLGEAAQHGSLRSKLSLALEEQAQRLSEHESAVADRKEEAVEYEQVVAEPVYRAGRSGVVAEYAEREAPVVAGAVLDDESLLRVYPPNEAVVEILVPEEMRNAVTAAALSAVTAAIRIPAMNNRTFAGQLTAIATTKKNYPPVYVGTVAFAETPPDLKVGATVVCRLAIALQPHEVLLPSWWASPDFLPRVRLASGEERQLRARVFGDWLIVEDGLRVGDVVLAPPRRQEGTLLLHGKVEAPNAEVIEVSGRSWYWLVEEMIDDGAEVEAGDVVATLRLRRGRLPTHEAVKLAELKAAATKELAVLGANSAFGDAYLTWQEAEVAAEKARLDYLIERYASNDEKITQAKVDSDLQKLDLEEARGDAERLQAAVYEEVYSQGERRQRQLTAEVAALTTDKAARDAVAARQFRKWPQVWVTKQSYFNKRTAAEKARQAYQAAKVARRKALSSAEADYLKGMRDAQELLDQANGTELRAPVSGRIYYNNDGRRPLEAGRSLPTSEPFRIPTDRLRRFAVDVPARLYGELKAGDEIAFHLPSEGAVARTGKVTHVADFFERVSLAELDDEAEENEAVAGESTVRVEIEFEADDAVGAPPGTTAVVELAL